MSCPDCLTGDILPGEPTGAYSIQGAYLAQAPDSSRNPYRAILLLTDAFGLPLKNSKVLADKFATELQCDVWVPDYFEDDLFFGRKYRLQVEASFAERQGTGNFVDYEFKDYEGWINVALL
ncbi:hypothetical protein C0993_011865 [Termitomyces sp. T159_Od127]|nr:hypothetical protein C0993_011865 [Termitomyces sp. T159_Od127]